MNKPLDLPLPEFVANKAELAKRLRQETSGELMTDIASRGRYATDASIYQALRPWKSAADPREARPESRCHNKNRFPSHAVGKPGPEKPPGAIKQRGD